MYRPNRIRSRALALTTAVAVLGGAGCSLNPFDDSVPVGECPKNFSAVSIEVESAAGPMQSLAALAQQTVREYSYSEDEDPYNLDNEGFGDGVGTDGGVGKFNAPGEVICTDGDRVYLSEDALRVVAAARSDRWEIDLEEGTATLPEEEPEW